MNWKYLYHVINMPRFAAVYAFVWAKYVHARHGLLINLLIDTDKYISCRLTVFETYFQNEDTLFWYKVTNYADKLRPFFLTNGCEVDTNNLLSYYFKFLNIVKSKFVSVAAQF